MGDVIPLIYYNKIRSEIHNCNPAIVIHSPITRDFLDSLDIVTTGCSSNPIYRLTIPKNIIVSCRSQLTTDREVYLQYEDLISCIIYYKANPGNFIEIGRMLPRACFHSKSYPFELGFDSYHLEIKTAILNNVISFIFPENAVKMRSYVISINKQTVDVQLPFQHQLQLQLQHQQKPRHLLNLPVFRILTHQMQDQLCQLTMEQYNYIIAMIRQHPTAAVALGPNHLYLQRCYHILLLVLKLSYCIHLYTVTRAHNSNILQAIIRNKLLLPHIMIIRSAVHTEQWNNIWDMMCLHNVSQFFLQEILRQGKLHIVPLKLFTEAYGQSDDIKLHQHIRQAVVAIKRHELSIIVNDSKPFVSSKLKNSWS